MLLFCYYLLFLQGLRYPISIHDIDEFERRNSGIIGVNVFSCVEDKEKFDIIRDAGVGFTNYVNLLLLSDDATDNHHFHVINNINGLLARQINIKKGYRMCNRCRRSFKKATIDTHFCMRQEIEMPDELDSMMKFNNLEAKVPVPFYIVADIECMLMKKSMHNIKHIPAMCGYLLVCTFDSRHNVYEEFFGERCIEDFLFSLKNLAKSTYKNFMHPSKAVALKITSIQLEEYATKTHCYVCEKEFIGDKIKEHCHFTGKQKIA